MGAGTGTVMSWDKCLQHGHPIRALSVRDPAAALLFQLPAERVGKASEGGPSRWAPAILMGDWDEAADFNLAQPKLLWAFGQ